MTDLKAPSSSDGGTTSRQSRISRLLWLFRYYSYNAIFSKALGRWEKRRISHYNDRWKSIKKRFEGIQEFIVVCNGPSLTAKDLEKLAGIPSIASNKIFLIFPHTFWRPDLYTICDPLLSYKLRKDPFDGIEDVLCAHSAKQMLRSKKTLPWLAISMEEAIKAEAEEGGFTADPCTGIFEGFTITVQNIQVAIWLGAMRIFLIGCDHSYTEEQSSEAGKKLQSSGADHFDPAYRKAGEIVNNAPIDRMNRSYRFIHQIAVRCGIEIINISRRTALDEFPRESVEQVLARR